jgi:amidophosphoribosyltransferase
MAQTLNLPFEMGLERNFHQRAFINGPDNRLAVLQQKFTPLDEAIRGRTVWMVDDTLVRHDTSHVITQMLRKAGAKSVEWFICAPMFQGTCYYGIAVGDVEELAYWQAVKQLPRELQKRALRGEVLPEINELIAKGIEADRVKFHDLNTLFKALPGQESEYCHGCFGRQYPTPRGQQDFERSLRKMFPDLLPA